MAIPTLQFIGTVYQLYWEKEDVKIQIDRIIEKHEAISAEILVTKGGGHLYLTRLNLLGANSKKALATELSKRFDSLDWATMIEQAFVRTLTEYRQGEPVISVGNLPARTTPRYRLYPFILEGERNVLYGYGGTGKSKLSGLIAMLVQTGTAMLGMRPIKGNVLILDWETSQYTVDEWVKAMKTGMHFETNETPFYRYCTRGLVEDIAQIQKEVLERKIDLVIVDSVGIAIAGDAQSQDITRQYFNALRSLKIASLSIDHKPHGGNHIYGSIYKTTIARSVFEMCAVQSAGSKILDIGIYHRKANDIPLIKPLGYRIEFIGDEELTQEAIFSKQDIADIPDLESGLSHKERIANLLKHGSMEVKDIAEELDIKETIARAILNRYKRTFVRAEQGWGLLSTYE